MHPIQEFNYFQTILCIQHFVSFSEAVLFIAYAEIKCMS